jgi:hypothetical protein
MLTDKEGSADIGGLTWRREFPALTIDYGSIDL